MATDLLLIVLVVAALLIVGVIREAHGRVLAHGLLKLIWRYHTGQPWHGKPVTDRGWNRPGKKAFTPTGHAPRFHYKTRRQQTIQRCSRSAILIVLFILWLNNRPIALAATAFVIAGWLAWRGLRAWRKVRRYKHRRTWVEPAHLQAAPLVGIPIENPPSSWLQVAEDRSWVRAELPPGWNPDGKEKERLVSTLATKLGIESPEVKFMLAGPEPRLELEASKPPPARVALADVREHLDKAKADDLIWGLGKRGVLVKTSLSGDSPHVGLSMGSGAGKSVTARSLLAGQLYKGAIGLILDYKMISHQWAAGLPNVAIARRPAEIHRALLWLGREVERRNEVALAGADMDGNVHAVVGARLIVVCEELNATVAKLRAYWRQERENSDPVRSPALEALDATSFMGRQVLTNIIYIGQRLSVKASGGDGDARENIGVIGFGRYSASNWKMLAPDHPMPPKSLAPGRIQVVSDQVRETQGVFMSAAEARALATAGKVSLLPHDMPFAPRVTATESIPIPGPDLGVVTDTDLSPVTAGPQLVTLSEAVADGIVSCSLAALRIARHRGQLPEPAGMRGMAQEFDPLKLAEWDAGRR